LFQDLQLQFCRASELPQRYAVVGLHRFSAFGLLYFLRPPLFKRFPSAFSEDLHADFRDQLSIGALFFASGLFADDHYFTQLLARALAKSQDRFLFLNQRFSEDLHGDFRDQLSIGALFFASGLFADDHNFTQLLARALAKSQDRFLFLGQRFSEDLHVAFRRPAFHRSLLSASGFP
jgi:hypothetical protein